MLWSRFVSIICGGALVLGRSMPAADVAARVTLSELLSHDCARDVAGAVETGRQPGPVFTEGGLVFASTLNANHHPVLMVDAGAGVYAVELVHQGINRVRFELPGAGNAPSRTYFMSYLHDSAFRSRYLEFATDAPPEGHFELDYLLVDARRAANLLPNLEYAIMETSATVLKLIRSGHLAAADVRRLGVASCGHLAREHPALARSLEQNLTDASTLIAASRGTRASNRVPASLP